MLNLATLSPTEKRDLADAIDYILDYIGMPVSVSKAKTPDYGKKLLALEKKIAAALKKAWAAKTKEAVNKAVEALQDLGDQLSEMHAEIIANGLGEILGRQFVETVKDELVKHIVTAYDMVGRQTAKELEIPYAFTLVDQKAIDWLTKDMTYWVGAYYNTFVKNAVTAGVKEYAVKQGQDAWTTGQRLKEVIGGEKVPPNFVPHGYVRVEQYFEGLACNAITRATVFGRIEPMLQADVETYEIISAGDSRVCWLCHEMDGKTFSIQEAVKIRDAMLNAQNPDDIKAIHPWPKLEEVKGKSEGELAKAGIALPDFHFFCRCDYVASSFTYYEKPLEVEPEPVVPKSEVPDSIKGLKNLGSGAHLGGAGEKYIYQDKKGNKFLFKPAVSKAGAVEPFRAYVQMGCSELAKRIFDPGDFIEIKAMFDEKGRLGTLQKLLPDVEGDFKKLDWHSTVATGQIKMIQQEHVLDWVVGNFDSHAGNFILTAGGKIFGIDKEQAFRYLNDPKSRHMSLDYHPNAVYGEQEPIYNTVYREFAEGKIDLDLQAVLPTLKRLEAISDQEYREIFRPYAEALHGQGSKKTEELLNKIVARKQVVREEYRRFFTSLLKQRDPAFKGIFKFADEMTATQAAQAPISASTLTEQELKKLTVKSLKVIAKDKQIKYFQSMTKDELVQALAHPELAEQLSERAKLRWKEYSRAGAREKAKEPAKPQDVIQDFDMVPDTPFGMAVTKDADKLANLQLNIRRMAIDNKIGFQVQMRVTEPYYQQVEESLKRQFKAKGGNFQYYRGGVFDKGLGCYRAKSSQAHRIPGALVAKGNGFEIYYGAPGRAGLSYEGYLEIRVWNANGEQAAKKFQEILDDLGLSEIKHDPTEEVEKALRLRRLRLLWQHAPKEASRIPVGATSAELAELCRKAGIDPKRADRLVKKEVFPGYWTYVEPGISEEYRKAGAEYLWAGVGTDPRTVMLILGGDTPGMLSTFSRMQNGIIGRGGSEEADIRSGGADQGYVRLATRRNLGKSYERHYKGQGYRLLFDVKELERTDWYAYNADNFGTTDPRTFHNRLSAIDHIKEVDDYYSFGNEIMFRKGISMENLIGITCDSMYQKDRLIEVLQEAGINKIKGIPLDDFIQVKTKL